MNDIRNLLKLTKIIVRRLTPDDQAYFTEAEDLFRRTGAWGNLQSGSLAHFCASPACGVFGAFDGEKLIGASVVAMMTERQLSFWEVYGSKVKENFGPGKIVVILATVLEEEHRGKGLGKELLRIRMEWAIDAGAKFAITNSWVNGTRFNSNRLFEADGFQTLATFSAYDPQSTVTCPRCGIGCRCENRVYFKTI